MQNTTSLYIRILLLITGGLTHCLALMQISVIKGDTLTLKCPLKNFSMNDSLEWKNPEGFMLFFNRHKALRDKRSEVVSLTRSEYSIRVTNITFKDGGVYKCLHYHNNVSTKRYKVIVIGAPKLEKDEQEDKASIRCSASANGHPPALSWLMDNGLEIEAHPYYEVENVSKKYTAVSQLNVKIPKKRITVKCLVRHSALHGSQLQNFIHLGNQSQDTSTSSTTTGSTYTTVIPTLFSRTSHTNTHSESETTNYSNTSVNKTTEGTSTNSSTNVLNNTTANETTEVTPVNNIIKPSSNTTGNDSRQVDAQSSKKGNSTLLVLLVTCLIICLVVVLTFFLIRLRKAHIAWKKENEESDQSVESSRSKSSNEEKQKQQQKGQGFCNTSFTKYKTTDETLQNGTQASPASVQVINENPQHFISISGIKETEL